MEKVYTEVKSFRVDVYCDCGGELKDTGYMLATYPPQYRHECQTCARYHNLDKAYPTVEYR